MSVVVEVARKAGRPTKAATNANFEAEILRLYRLGKPIGDAEKPGTIAGITKASRRTVFRVIAKAADASQTVATQMKQERKYHKETEGEFQNEPAIKEWIEDMKLRRVEHWQNLVAEIKKMCDELQIFPDQLVPLVDEAGKRDFTWARKWLTAKSDVPLNKLRNKKNAFRAFAKKYGATDYELTLAGFDAKHYGVGKWKHVQMTEEQIRAVEAYLRDPSHFAEQGGREEALFAFKFGIETCRPLEPVWNVTSGQFYTLETEVSVQEKRRIQIIKQLSQALPPGMALLFAELLNVSPEALMAELGEGKKTLYCVNVFRRKTEKAGAPYKTAYVSRSTYELAKELGKKNSGRLMDGFKPKAIYPFLKAAYAAAGCRAIDPDDPTKDYFQAHSMHCLRHSGAQRLLQRTGFNRAVVAELGGWEAEKTLEDHYGGVPEDVVRGVAGSLL